MLSENCAEIKLKVLFLKHYLAETTIYPFVLFA
jgi:hypothetical protein